MGNCVLINHVHFYWGTWIFVWWKQRSVLYILSQSRSKKKVTTDAHKTFLTIPPRTESSFHSSTMQKLIKDWRQYWLQSFKMQCFLFCIFIFKQWIWNWRIGCDCSWPIFFIMLIQMRFLLYRDEIASKM